MSSLPPPLANYQPRITESGLVFLPGQGCRDPQTNQCVGISRRPDGSIESYDITAQVRGVFRNIETLLESVGLNKGDLVDVTVFMKNKQDFDAMNVVWNEFFTGTTPPARTTVFVADLPSDNFVEMKALAVTR